VNANFQLDLQLANHQELAGTRMLDKVDGGLLVQPT
jgi:hypothetical protein